MTSWRDALGTRSNGCVLLFLVLVSFVESLSVGDAQSNIVPLGSKGARTAEEDVIALWMPNVNTTTEDEYHCLGRDVDFDIKYITKYVPHASEKSVHHILIYGCSTPIRSESTTGAWKCRDDHPIQSACTGRSKFLFAWAKDAPAFQLPKDVAFQIGRKTDVQGLFIQIHYSTLVTNDNSGISIIFTDEPRRFAAGILLLAAGGQYIPPHEPVVNVNIMCKYDDDVVLHPFGFRTHAHSLGTVISGWYMKPEDQPKEKWTMMGKQSPQNPQSFYTMDAPHNITAGTILGARCVFNSTERDTITFMGSTHKDEMCNFYMMYYADRNTNKEMCADIEGSVSHLELPAEASIPLPASQISHHHHGAIAIPVKAPHSHPAEKPAPANFDSSNLLNVLGKVDSIPKPTAGREGEGNAEDRLDDHSGHHNHMLDNAVNEGKMSPADNHEVMGKTVALSEKLGYEEDTDWSEEVTKQDLGQISGVALDHSQENVYIFHRRDHPWDGSSFDFKNGYSKIADGPIAKSTILVVEAGSGKTVKRLGENMFYMPHGITVDHDGNLWLTDVALHQVVKMSADGKVSLLLGKKFKPGHDGSHFCKPTMVAVTKQGDFFVADGYCNSRIIRFSPEGRYISHIGSENYSPFGSINPAPEEFFIPHDIKLSSDENTLFVADRENGRIQAFDAKNGKFLRLIHLPEFGFKLFALDLTDDLMVAVNGATGLAEEPAVTGIAINISTTSVIEVFNSKISPLVNPHAVTISRDESCVYVVELNGHAHKFHRGGVGLIPLKPSKKLNPSLTDTANMKHAEALNATKYLIPKFTNTQGFSVLFLALICVPTLIVLGGAIACCVKHGKTSSSQTKWKELLFQYGNNIKNPVDLGGYRARKEGFRPLAQHEAPDGSSDSEDEAFSARHYQRNALA